MKIDSSLERYATGVVAILSGFAWAKLCFFLGGFFSPLSWLGAIVIGLVVAYFCGKITRIFGDGN